MNSSKRYIVHKAFDFRFTVRNSRTILNSVCVCTYIRKVQILKKIWKKNTENYDEISKILKKRINLLNLYVLI